MKKFLSLVLIFLFFSTTLNASYFGNKTKKSILNKTTSSLIKKKTTQKVVKNIASKTKDTLLQNEKKKIFAKTEVANSHAPNGVRTVYQREIDRDYAPKVINDKTKKIEQIPNSERMKKGQAPYIVGKDGKPEKVELHHSRQNNNGSLFELGTKIHNKTKEGQGAEAIHPYRTERGRKINEVDKKISGKSHPEYPINRKEFDKERETYWKERDKDLEQKQLLGTRIN